MTPMWIESVGTLALRGASALLALQPDLTPGGGGAAPRHAGGGGPAGGGTMQIVMMVAMFALVWLYVFRPMRQQQKEQESVQQGLKKGERVVTTSGIIGTVHEVREKEIVLEVSDRTRLTFLRDSVSKRYDGAADTKPSEADKK